MSPSSAHVDLTQTVCAVATPPGRGGVGIVRLSGPRAIEIADRVFRGRSKLRDQAGYTVRYGFTVDPSTGIEIDEVLVTVFRSPKSFTGEDLVELSAHGGQLVLGRIVDALIGNGAVPAQPGEFTLRAFLNGRIDLTEAEAVADLIAAKTEESAAAALRQLKGHLRDEIRSLRAHLLAILVQLEVGIDFTEEDVDPKVLDGLRAGLLEIKGNVDHLLKGYQRGKVLRDGFTVVLAGPPNSGKSTLFNYLAHDERAIVTDIPGTTRDILREYINLNGWPVCIVDTAGMREAKDAVERIGVERAAQAIDGADAVVWVIDGKGDWKNQISPPNLAPKGIPVAVCYNKFDALSPKSELFQILGTLPLAPDDEMPVMAISARTGYRIDDLLKLLGVWVQRVGAGSSSSGTVINDRHRLALEAAAESIQSAIDAVSRGAGPELVAFDTKNAAVALGEIIGVTTTDDVLEEIFSNFCIGK